MARKKLLLPVAVGGLVLAVVGGTTALAATSTSSGSSTTSSAANSSGGGTTPTGCQYPSSRAPKLTLSPSTTTMKAGSAKFTGTITVNSCGVGNRRIALYTATTKAGSYTPTGTTATTGANGSYTMTQSVRTSAWFKAYFAGDASFDPAWSAPVQVTITR